MGKPIIDIIFVRYNCKQIEDEAIESIINNTDTKKVTYRIIDYDNYNQQTQRGKHTLTHLWNILIEKSNQEYICLLNSDIKIVDEKWLEKLYRGIESNSLIAAIGPSTNNTKGITQVKNENIKNSAFKIIYTKDITGFCYLMRKSIWKKLKGFNEKFRFYGAESEYNLRVTNNKYKLAYCPSAFVFHYGEMSIKAADRRRELSQKREREVGIHMYWEAAKKYGNNL